MKRASVISVLIIFILGTFGASFAFAAKTDKNGNSQASQQTKAAEERDASGTKASKKAKDLKDEDELQQDSEDTEDAKDRAKDTGEDSDLNQKKAGASGTPDTSWFDYKNPKKEYRITSEEQLLGLASLVNQEQVARWKPTRTETFEGVTFKLTKDIKMTTEWTPIGTSESICFAGSFDGDGHTISNMIIKSNADYIGFFGYLKGEVKDLNIAGSIVSTGGECGGIVGSLDAAASVSGCNAKIDIKAGKKTGGIVGSNNGGKIENCVSRGDISGTYKVGGVVGENWGGTVKKCGNEGDVSSSVRGVATFGTGGIAGRSVAEAAIVSECYNVGNIKSAAEATGGVIGYMNADGSTLTNSYSTGNITIKDVKKQKESQKLTKAWAGGVAGVAGSKGVVIANCYSSGTIKNADVSGGVIGKFVADTKDPTEANIKNNFYLNDTIKAGIGDNKGQGKADIQKCATGVSGSTLSGMSSALSISFMKDASGLYGNDGYPVLRWQDPIDSSDKSYLEGVSTDVQKKLDQYLIKNTDATNKGDIVISIFHPDNYLTDALLMYTEAIDQNEQKQDSNKDNEE